MIKVENATQMYRSTVIFSGANFRIAAGERLAIVGRNGAGKTTFLNALAGFSRLKKGSITINGRAVHRARAWRGSLSFLPEKFQLYPQLSVEENVSYFARLIRLSEDDVPVVLTYTNMWEHREKRISQLSKGMLQRVGLSIALLGEPDWIVLDEPTSGLDPFGRMEVLQLMREMGSSGRSLLFTTHYMDEVRELATHVLFLHDRKVDKLAAGDFLKQFERSMAQ
ncbi:ABC transporter ATP-binding protein [Lentibacillus sp.]|uniref:ABC transporter ATP-binding protein n=1 Tax=Lentibacillus sp. TaxID=1925746 RepID=UPI002B4B38BC|nr:ABC transporter ATP-binding protein [Lentibacillus sp.]HLS09448.1 ABC transporter ATP-binding protein [Lentibacillus sp.]